MRLGVSVGRKVGGATERNKVKRAMREAFWRLSDRLPPGYDFVLVGRSGIADLIDREGTAGLTTCLASLLDEAGDEVSGVARETVAGPTGGVARETPRIGLGAKLALLPIRFYRRFLSPALGQRCRYYPTCSAYAEEAVRELGAFRGMILAAWRVLRCNPFSTAAWTRSPSAPSSATAPHTHET